MLKRVVLGMFLMGAVNTSAVSHEIREPMAKFKSVMQELDLSLSQKMDIRSIVKSTRGDMKVYREDMQTLRNTIERLVKSDNYSEEAVLTEIVAQEAVMKAIASQRFSTKSQVLAVLTDEQAEQFRSLMAQQPQIDSDKIAQRKQKLYEKLELDATEDADIIAALDAVMASKKAMREVRKSFAQTQVDVTDQAQWDANFAVHFDDIANSMVATASSHRELWLMLDEELREVMEKIAKKRRNKRG